MSCERCTPRPIRRPSDVVPRVQSSGLYIDVWFNPGVRGLGFGAVVALAIGGVIGCGADADAPSASGAPHFVAETGGIDHRYDGDFQYFVGGGVAAFDCDDDGRSDLFFAGGSEPAALYRNESPVGGALRFTPIASADTDLTAVTGAYPLDVDSDGHTDLAVLRVGEDVLLRGLGDCRFERANEALGFDGGDSWTVGFSATWEGSNELPTLAFGDYLAADRETCADSRLVRPAGTRLRPADRPGARLLHVVDAVQRLVPVGPAGPAPHQRSALLPRRLGSAVEDRAGRGTAAVHGGRRVASAADLGNGHRQPGRHGRRPPEVFLTSQGDNKLQTLADGCAAPTYEDIALRLGVTAHRPYTGGDVLPSTAWHAEFADVNNDSFTDLFIAKGNVEAQDGYAMHDPTTFFSVSPTARSSRAARRPGSPPSTRREARRWSTSTSTGCSIWSSSTAPSRSRCGATPARRRRR